MFSGCGGYFNSSLANGNYNVSYSTGHIAFHNKDIVRDFALRRACELSLEKGFAKFQVCNERGNDYGCSLEIHLTNSNRGDALDAKATLSTIHNKYKKRSNN